MSGNSGDLTAANENSNLGPDLFSFYAREATELLSHDKDLLPFPHQASHLAENIHEVGKGKGQIKNSCRSSLFSDGLGAQLSEFKRERLKVLLRQSVSCLTQEVEEMIDPVLSVCRIHSCLKYKERVLSSNALACKDDQLEHPHKKCKASTASSSPCNSSGLGNRMDLKDGSTASSNVDAGKESVEIGIDDDLQYILENDASKVEELLKKHSSEISDMLDHMEQKLEELLNTVMTTSRLMTISEKQHLRKLIQTLPPANLNRIVDIIEWNKPSGKPSCDEVYVDLDEQDNATLWRLYFYIQTLHAITGIKIAEVK